jgi:hypothetical protein
MDVKVPIMARLTTDITVTRADGSVEHYRVKKDGTLRQVGDTKWQTFTLTLAKTLLPTFSMVRSLLRRITT